MAHWNGNPTESAALRPFVSNHPGGNERMDSEDGSQTGVMVAEPKTKPKRPPFYKVVLLNDDYTPMEFVVHVLQAIFRKDQEDAVRVMLEVHQKGAGLCGVYTREVAETKVEQVIQFARRNEHPLQCVMEQE